MNKATIMWIIVLVTAIGISVVGYNNRKVIQIGWMKYTANVSPPVRQFVEPKRHEWKPERPRQIQVN